MFILVSPHGPLCEGKSCHKLGECKDSRKRKGWSGTRHQRSNIYQEVIKRTEVRGDTEHSPGSSRQVTAGWFYDIVQGQENRPTSYRSRKIGIRKIRAGTAGFMFPWDVGLTPFETLSEGDRVLFHLTIKSWQVCQCNNILTTYTGTPWFSSLSNKCQWFTLSKDILASIKHR